MIQFPFIYTLKVETDKPFSTVAWFIKYFAVSFDVFGGVSEYLCSKDQQLLDWTQHQLLFSFHTLLPTSNSSHISFLLPLYAQLQVWRSRKILSTATPVHQKIVSGLGGIIHLGPVHDCAVGFSSAHVSVMPNWSNVLLLLESLDLWQLPMTISSFEWAPMDCSVSEMKFYSIIFPSLLLWNWLQFQNMWRVNCSLKYTKIDFA